MTTYEKYLQWKAEQTSESPSIKDFCEWLDNPEMVRQDEYGKIADSNSLISCSYCIYKENQPIEGFCFECFENNKDSEYYYAKPD